MATAATQVPAVIPITTPSVATADPTAPAATPAIRSFISRLSETLRRSTSDLKPWQEMVDRSALTRPSSLSEATSRLRKNLSYFRVNYTAVVALSLALSLVTHPVSLFLLLSLLAAWSFLYLFRPADPPLSLFGRTFSDRETLGGLVLVSIIVIFMTSVGSLIISAITVGALLVCIHGALRVPEDLFLDEPDQQGGAAAGLLSFLGGAASSVASAAPVVASRV
ncbi:PRA1 (Prenylated rab acceptor) family protein [Rhynchospora pubera]|uniref:PRA1 family protein n=1 Tax=Rhynchospora pubera TaxID=906938 RepID=A0AAV8DTP8_9POAL|nr:PRA1 (Prenylated rab acceptor) family protein [Rhynchospora pubera]KAJ4807528.1 PRA1 (Prenylated rab acceptor) family protein [Rhynchospora pubera]